MNIHLLLPDQIKQKVQRPLIQRYVHLVSRIPRQPIPRRRHVFLLYVLGAFRTLGVHSVSISLLPLYFNFFLISQSYTAFPAPLTNRKAHFFFSSASQFITKVNGMPADEELGPNTRKRCAFSCRGPGRSSRRLRTSHLPPALEPGHGFHREKALDHKSIPLPEERYFCHL